MKFKKLSEEKKIANKGGFSFSVVLGIMTIIQTVSMIIPFVTNMITDNKKNSIIKKPQKQEFVSYKLSQNYSDNETKTNTIFFS